MGENNLSCQIIKGHKKAGKTYSFNDGHDENIPFQIWFQESEIGKILFVVFYSLTCRWSRCQGCNLPSQMSINHVSYKALMNQIDNLFNDSRVKLQAEFIKKIIISNNGSILDEETFSSSALMYLITKTNLNLPNLAVMCIETRPEYVDYSELDFISRALSEGNTPTELEIAIGFEAYDEQIRNGIFDKGLSFQAFEKLAKQVAPFRYRLKCYFMLKPIADFSDDKAVKDIHKAIDYLSDLSSRNNLNINIHLNPTYVAKGTVLEKHFDHGDYSPPYLIDVIKAVNHGKGKNISIFIGLSDEGLAVEGGSFIRPGDTKYINVLELFNQTQDYSILTDLILPVE